MRVRKRAVPFGETREHDSIQMPSFRQADPLRSRPPFAGRIAAFSPAIRQ